MKKLKRWYYLLIMFIELDNTKGISFRWARYCLHVNRPILQNPFISSRQRSEIEKYLPLEKINGVTYLQLSKARKERLNELKQIELKMKSFEMVLNQSTKGGGNYKIADNMFNTK